MALSIGVLLAVPLLALNLRPAVTSMGSLLTDIRSDTGMSAALASAVVAVPVWCFAAGGGLAWALRIRYGTGRTVTYALAVLAVALVARVFGGPYLLLAGTVAACLAIAVLGTLLPAIVHAAPAREWATLTGCYIAALGSGSAVGALITPQISHHTSWQLGASSWALLAMAAGLMWRVAARRLPEQPVAATAKPSPLHLRPATTAWSLTVHFGLTSGFTFSIMGWLPSILMDRAQLPPSTVAWLFTVAMALGVPVALRVPAWARRSSNQAGLAVLLALPSLVGVVGLLIAPTMMPWVWAAGLGLGMPAVGLALAAISLRADKSTDTAAALSSMVQGFGYALAGATALGCGLLYSATQSWEVPLAALLVVLCGQISSGAIAGLPVTVRSCPRVRPSRRAAAQPRQLPPGQPVPPVRPMPASRPMPPPHLLPPAPAAPRLQPVPSAQPVPHLQPVARVQPVPYIPPGQQPQAPLAHPMPPGQPVPPGQLMLPLELPPVRPAPCLKPVARVQPVPYVPPGQRPLADPLPPAPPVPPGQPMPPGQLMLPPTAPPPARQPNLPPWHQPNLPPWHEPTLPPSQYLEPGLIPMQRQEEPPLGPPPAPDRSGRLNRKHRDRQRLRG
ncbi:MAG TPA: MFS transporter [Actinophytocola sp.]|uniref:MFS transporter n=1 Tax=Actinophytocola sp. TaxID=1872138 RepID=UPI002DDD6C26|nr:MFS transporter [Actinophytocola sp.]HEV2778322.1 MFS transporter [Actinophytocola sp.]